MCKIFLYQFYFFLMFGNLLSKLIGDSDKSSEPGSIFVAKPIDSNKLDEMLSKITLSSDKVHIVFCLSPNIASIKFLTFKDLLDSTYSADIQSLLWESFFQRIESMNVKNIEIIINKLRSDENKINFCAKYKDYLLTYIEGFDPKNISGKIIRKTDRNRFNEIFSLPLEVIQNRSDGFEVFGTFVKTSDMVVDETLTFIHPIDKYRIVKLTKLNRGNIQIQEQTSSGFSSTSMSFSGVWVIDDYGFHPE